MSVAGRWLPPAEGAVTNLIWDGDCEQELAAAEAELERSRYVEPVSPEAAIRARQRIATMEQIVARLRARKENAS